MKTLIIIRHAKSSWDNPDLGDFERGLNRRGLRDAPFMADVLKEKNIKPDIIVSSPAVRAITTAKFFAEALQYPQERILTKELIYERGAKQILYLINETRDSSNCVLLFGHNPDLSLLSQYLCDFSNGNLPTCGIVCIDFDTDSWTNIGEEPGKLRFFVYPKMYIKK